MPRFRSVLAAVAVLGIAWAGAGPAWAQRPTAWYEGFEGPEASWRELGGDAQYHIERHERLQGQAHTGTGCEALSLQAGHGTYVHVGHDAGQPRVIDELLITVWIRSDRPGLQLGARIVLPRSEDPRTGHPLSTLVYGSSYTRVGQWQQLRLGDVPQLLARQVRALRLQAGPHVEDREAYVEAAVLNVYGGAGVTNVWIDDLDVAGYVARPTPIVPVVGPSADRVRSGIGASPPRRLPGPLPSPTRPVSMDGSVLMVEGRPMFPRILWYQGEPLGVVKQLGFNTAWLPGPPTPELLSEVSRQGLWLVCPPPLPIPAESSEPSEPSFDVSTPIGPEYDRVLAWDLGRRLSRDRVEPTRRWAERMRQADSRGRRPLVCGPEGDLRGFSRHVDLVLVDRQPLGTSLELTDYGTWVSQQPLLVRPGTPIWTTVQTQAARAVCQQLAALEPGRPLPGIVDPEQIRLLVYTAVAAGSRGLLFWSDSPLDAADLASRRRAMALELLNAELTLLEPWAAAGTVLATAESNERDVLGAVLRMDRCRLLLPIRSAPGAQCVPAQSTATGLSLVMPGAPESSSVYQLLPGSLRPLRNRRVAGGMQVMLEEFGQTDQILLAQEPLLIDALSRRTAQTARRVAELRRHLAAMKWEAAQQTVAELAPVAKAPPQSAERLAEARQHLQRCDSYLAANESQSAWLDAGRAVRAVQMVERAYWETAVTGLSPVGSPGAGSFATLPWHWRLGQRIAASRVGPNRLAASDFEDSGAMLAAGWRHFQHAPSGIQTAAELAREAAHGGQFGLRLSARPIDPKNPPRLVESPPMWIVTPSVAVEAGQLLRIRGWVQVPTPLTGNVDGLQIVDSLTGEALAERVVKTAGWQQFTLFRVAPQSGPMTLAFVLSGLGEVWLDDVALEALER